MKLSVFGLLTFVFTNQAKMSYISNKNGSKWNLELRINSLCKFIAAVLSVPIKCTDSC